MNPRFESPGSCSKLYQLFGIPPSLILLTILAASVHGIADDWPQWRGTKRNGHATGVRLPKTWSTNAPPLRWRTEIGEGQSSPVVAGGRIFVMGRGPAGDEIRFALDLDTGKILWKKTRLTPYRPADPTAGMGPKSTPTVDGDRVYFYGVAGRLSCHNVSNGDIVWTIDCQSDFWGVLKDSSGDDAWSTCCGAAASPLIDGKRLILPIGGKKAGALTAMDKLTGTILWRSLTDRSSYASPVHTQFGDQCQIVAFTGRRMVGVNPENGDLAWDFPFTAEFEQTVITPVIWNDLVLVGGERKPTTALRIQPDKNTAAQSVAWLNKDLRCYLCTPVVVGDHVYGLNEARNQLVCARLIDGTTTWTEELAKYATFVSADDVLLILTDNLELHIVEANPEKFAERVVWRLSEQGKTMSHLLVVGNRIIVKANGDLLCYEMSDTN